MSKTDDDDPDPCKYEGGWCVVHNHEREPWEARLPKKRTTRQEGGEDGTKEGDAGRPA